MDPRPKEFPGSLIGLKYDNEILLPGFDQSENFANIFKYNDDSVGLNFMDSPPFPSTPDTGYVAPTSSGSSEADSPDEDFSENVLKYINQILMEENLEQKPSTCHDPLALQAAEKSFYEILGQKYPPAPDQLPFIFRGNVDSPDDNLVGSSSENSSNSNITAGTYSDPQCNVDPGEYNFQMHSNFSNNSFQSSSLVSSRLSFGSVKSYNGVVNGPPGSSLNNHVIPNIFSENQSVLQFKRGVEEASKFLPANNQLGFDLESYKLPAEPKETAPGILVKVEKDEKEYSFYSSKGGKNHKRDDNHLEERSTKQSAIFMDESQEAELSEMFDRVLLCTDQATCCNTDDGLKNEETKTLPQSAQVLGSNGRKTRAKRQGKKKDVVDLRTLLINCAQSVAVDDRRTANEQLKQIRQHSSPFGDASQRLAHVFANGIEARLAGTGSQIYEAFIARQVSAVDMLKAYQVYISACPFKKIAVSFANKLIAELAAKSTKKKLHIVDFGILYGFQWPILIQHLSTFPGGPPELRITGIEYPRSGFRPLEQVVKTGHRLAKYCDRFGVPFKYHAIAQKWDTIKIDDLKLDSNEDLAVNCLFRFGNLLDETVMVDSPRDAVLKLIRNMNPDIFIHSIINGSYNAPFFVSRFREALFHYSSLFDMFEVNVHGQEQGRMHFEQEFYGREVLNVIACEGLERVERPETYKQCQARNTRCGFRILPLNQELVNKLRGKKAGYHKDFVVDEDSQWLLQGWKGRICYASSCWVPAQKAL